MKRITKVATMLLATLPLATYANIIVDTKDVDQEKYHADLYECQTYSQQAEQKKTDSLGHDLVSSTAKGAALGAAGGAISGGSGSKGAKVGAGIGIIGGALSHSAEKKYNAEQHELAERDIMRNCMMGRGYTVLN